MNGWEVSSSSDPRALAIVDGLGKFKRFGPHYSRRTPGSKTFTGIGQEIVLLHESGRAVWAVVRQATPSKPGSGASRGRTGQPDTKPRFVWRNMMFRNLYGGIASEQVWSATILTYALWRAKYGEIPTERLRTEVKLPRTGRCYELAGWERGETKRGKIYLYAPSRR